VRVFERIAPFRQERTKWPLAGLVPTMGALHEGHLSLLRAARAECETVVMSIFVNPAQFGPGEDLASYPRDTERDLKLAEQLGVDAVFMPPSDEVYPPGFDTWVEVGALTRRWEGESRPGHFRGVSTVVLKLLEVVQPERAYFGEKDYQQLQVVKKMVDDLNIPLEIVPCPTVREPSGLALSSRNFYLAEERRRRAAVLSKALQRGQELAASGVSEVGHLLDAMRRVVVEEPGARLDYLAVVDPKTLEPLERLDDRARVLAAMFFDRIRLIDNCELRLGEQPGSLAAPF
jgi:pantoate--beta-alanine ligase